MRNLSFYGKEYITKCHFVDLIRLKKGIDALYAYMKVLPVIEHCKGDLHYVGVRETTDMILKKIPDLNRL